MKFGEPWSIARERHRLMGDDEWRGWFAWRPVHLRNGEWVWLENVEFNRPMSYNLPTYRQAPCPSTLKKSSN
jgi:hypothetical protein